MKPILKKSIPSINETTKFAIEIANDFVKPETNATFFLEGGLGVGKTHIIREILKTLGVSGNIPSPTYTLVQEYNTDKQHFAHFDLYRLTSPDEFFARGFDEIATDNSIIKFVEWPDKISSVTKDGFSGKKYIIKITHGIGVGMRKIVLLNG